MKKTIICLSVIILILAMLVGSFFLFFPRRYASIIETYAIKYNLPKYLVASVINIESGYDKNAISSSNARGLMQLLPTTAEEIASKLNIDNFDENDLYDENVNIEFGCYYLSYLLDYYDCNITNTLCAYNWGLSNVNNWINDGNTDENGNIINIPVDETSNYIKKYRMNKFVYKNIYKY